MFADVLHELATPAELHDHNEFCAFDEGVVQLTDVPVLQLLNAVSFLVDGVHLISVGYYPWRKSKQTHLVIDTTFGKDAICNF